MLTLLLKINLEKMVGFTEITKVEKVQSMAI